MKSKYHCLSGLAILGKHAVNLRGSGVRMNFGRGFDFYGTMGINGTQIRIQKQPEHTGTINYDHMAQSMERQANYESPINVEIVESGAYMPEAANSGGGWEPYAGTAGAVASEMYYSEKYGTWMGKNFKMYKQQWGGNGYTGGKLKFGKKVSTGFKIGGYGLGIWNVFNINSQHSSGQISDVQMYMEQDSNFITTVGGLYGASWGVGWELGRAITNTGWYQEAKFNFWYNRWESQVGSPSQSNEALWYYFYQNYKP